MSPAISMDSGMPPQASSGLHSAGGGEDTHNITLNLDATSKRSP